MVGTWYFPYHQSPDAVSVTEGELRTCLEDINAAYPSAKLSLEDILHVHCGLLPSDGISQETGDVQLSKHYSIQHHQSDSDGLITISGVKYTTARDVAEKVIDKVAKIIGRSILRSETVKTPLYGGEISNLSSFLQQIGKESPFELSSQALQRLAYTYGTNCGKIIKAAVSQEYDAPWKQLLAAEIRYAVREEMAQHLSDVVLRRTDLGSAGKPKDDVLKFCADVMAEELNWGISERQVELQCVDNFYAVRVPRYQTKRRVASGS
jgi:glycerol-3-phosphate dehydrogenase